MTSLYSHDIIFVDYQTELKEKKYLVNGDIEACLLDLSSLAEGLY